MVGSEGAVSEQIHHQKVFPDKPECVIPIMLGAE